MYIFAFRHLIENGAFRSWVDHALSVAQIIYRVSHKLRSLLRESVPYVKIYRYNPKHLYPKLKIYGGNGQRKVWKSCISTYSTSTAVSRIDLDRAMQ